MKDRKLINWLGLTGLVALISYAAAVIFSPLAFPGLFFRVSHAKNRFYCKVLYFLLRYVIIL